MSSFVNQTFFNSIFILRIVARSFQKIHLLSLLCILITTFSCSGDKVFHKNRFAFLILSDSESPAFVFISSIF